MYDPSNPFNPPLPSDVTPPVPLPKYGEYKLLWYHPNSAAGKGHSSMWDWVNPLKWVGKVYDTVKDTLNIGAIYVKCIQLITEILYGLEHILFGMFYVTAEFLSKPDIIMKLASPILALFVIINNIIPTILVAWLLLTVALIVILFKKHPNPNLSVYSMMFSGSVLASIIYILVAHPIVLYGDAVRIANLISTSVYDQLQISRAVPLNDKVTQIITFGVDPLSNACVDQWHRLLSSKAGDLTSIEENGCVLNDNQKLTATGSTWRSPVFAFLAGLAFTTQAAFIVITIIRLTRHFLVFAIRLAFMGWLALKGFFGARLFDPLIDALVGCGWAWANATIYYVIVRSGDVFLSYVVSIILGDDSSFYIVVMSIIYAALTFYLIKKGPAFVGPGTRNPIIGKALQLASNASNWSPTGKIVKKVTSSIINPEQFKLPSVNKRLMLPPPPPVSPSGSRMFNGFTFTWDANSTLSTKIPPPIPLLPKNTMNTTISNRKIILTNSSSGKDKVQLLSSTPDSIQRILSTR